MLELTVTTHTVKSVIVDCCPSRAHVCYKVALLAGAVASNEVKQKLRECLLNKGQRDPGLLKNSPPDYRQW